MNKKITKRINERITLQEVLSSGMFDADEGKRFECEIHTQYRIVASNDEEPRTESEETNDSVLVDFDFNREVQTEFDIFMNIRYFWNDWNPLYTDVY